MLTTNAHLAKVKEKYSDETLNDNRNSYIGRKTEEEIAAFIGLFYVRHLLSLNKYRMKILFKDKEEHLIFAETMPKNCSKFLMFNICFDDETKGLGG